MLILPAEGQTLSLPSKKRMIELSNDAAKTANGDAKKYLDSDNFKFIIDFVDYCFRSIEDDYKDKFSK